MQWLTWWASICSNIYIHVSSFFLNLRDVLTHLSRMHFPISIGRMSLFQILGVLGGILHFIPILIEHSVSKQWRIWSDAVSAASDLGLRCLPMSHKKDARRILVKSRRDQTRNQTDTHAYFNPFNPNRFSHNYQLDKSIVVLRVIGGIIHFYSNRNRTFCKRIVETLIRRRVLRRLVWVCTICLCPTKRTLGLYGLRMTN